jgi:hypothetical protein
VTAEDAILRSRRDYVDYRLSHYRAWLQLARTVGQRVHSVGKAQPPP